MITGNPSEKALKVSKDRLDIRHRARDERESWRARRLQPRCRSDPAANRRRPCHRHPGDNHLARQSRRPPIGPVRRDGDRSSRRPPDRSPPASRPARPMIILPRVASRFAGGTRSSPRFIYNCTRACPIASLQIEGCSEKGDVRELLRNWRPRFADYLSGGVFEHPDPSPPEFLPCQPQATGSSETRRVEAEPQSRTAPMTITLNGAEMNRRSSHESSEPRIPERKSRTRFNADKHGGRAGLPNLPGEDPSVYQDRLDAWVGKIQPGDTVKLDLVELNIHASWQLNLAEVARLVAEAAKEVARRAEDVARRGRDRSPTSWTPLLPEIVQTKPNVGGLHRLYRPPMPLSPKSSKRSQVWTNWAEYADSRSSHCRNRPNEAKRGENGLTMPDRHSATPESRQNEAAFWEKWAVYAVSPSCYCPKSSKRSQTWGIWADCMVLPRPSDGSVAETFRIGRRTLTGRSIAFRASKHGAIAAPRPGRVTVEPTGPARRRHEDPVPTGRAEPIHESSTGNLVDQEESRPLSIFLTVVSDRTYHHRHHRIFTIRRSAAFPSPDRIG